MPLTIGQTIKQLKECIEFQSIFLDPAALPVYFDFCDCLPTDIDSWRGSYEEPALGWEPSGYSKCRDAADPRTSPSELIKRLEHSIGPIYTGWKGGEYTFTLDSPLHIANRGDAQCTMIKAIAVEGWRIVIHTLWTEYGGLS